MSEIIQVSQTDMLQAISTAEIDMQIATAKKYPRDTAAAVRNIAEMAMLDEETAQDCFYAMVPTALLLPSRDFQYVWQRLLHPTGAT